MTDGDRSILVEVWEVVLHAAQVARKVFLFTFGAKLDWHLDVLGRPFLVWVPPLLEWPQQVSS